VSRELVGVGPSPVLADREFAVRRALGSLSERDQELLLLVAWDRLEREQAAKVLGVRAGAFAVRLHRARRRFARALAAEDALQRGAGEGPTLPLA
jgi:DNA-directed RNA polymerase specialized sigma24 family protein